MIQRVNTIGPLRALPVLRQPRQPSGFRILSDSATVKGKLSVLFLDLSHYFQIIKSKLTCSMRSELIDRTENYTDTMHKIY